MRQLLCNITIILLLLVMPGLLLGMAQADWDSPLASLIVENDDADAGKKLIACGADVNEVDPRPIWNFPLFFSGVCKGRGNLMRLFLEAGANYDTYILKNNIQRLSDIADIPFPIPTDKEQLTYKVLEDYHLRVTHEVTPFLSRDTAGVVGDYVMGKKKLAPTHSGSELI